MSKSTHVRSTICVLALGALAACGGSEGPAPVVAPPVSVSRVQIIPGDVSVETGGTASLSASVFDQSGTALTGKVVTWTSSNEGVFTIDAAGLIRAIAVGSGIVTASSEGKSATVIAVVKPPTLASVTINVPSGPVAAGQQVMLTATLKDRTGAVVTGRFVTWSSNAPRVANVDANGSVVAFSAGTALITATSEGVSGTLSLVVQAPPGAIAPVITSISPEVLLPGTGFTIAGSNFVSGVANDLVYIGGIQAIVTSATPTQITGTVSGAYPCQSSASVPVEVTTAGGSASSSRLLRLSTSRTLAVGQSFMATEGAGRACNEIPATGAYIVSIFSTSTSPSSLTPVELNGLRSGAGSASIAEIVPPAAISSRATLFGRGSDAVSATVAREHAEHLQLSLDVQKRLGSARQYRRTPRLSAARMASAARITDGQSISAPSALEVVPMTVGDTTHINFYRTSCALTSATKITARVVYVGPKAIVLEDRNAPLAGKTDAELTALAKEWEEVSYPALVKNLADPLAYDAQTDNNGRIIMMFTPLVNNVAAGLLGFVWSCDFFPPTADKSVGASNQAEIFYARVITDSSATSTSLNSRTGWLRTMPSTLAHESKHIASFAERNATPLDVGYEEVWLEEATAQLAAEFYSRATYGHGWRANAGFDGVLDCEYKPLLASCHNGVEGMYNNFSWLSSYFQNYENISVISSNNGDGAALYGAAWLFTRWLTDTYGGNNEGAFTSSIVKNFQNTGVANLVQKSGRPWAELMSQFSLMLAADDVPGIGAPFVEQSWNLPAVMQGYFTAARSSIFPQTPLKPRQATFGNFVVNANGVRGGSATLIRVGGGVTGGSQVLDLHAAGGGALPASASVGIAVLRVQ